MMTLPKFIQFSLSGRLARLMSGATSRRLSFELFLGVVFALASPAATSAAPDTSLHGPRPTLSSLSYTVSTPADASGHLLDLYLPKAKGKVPLVIFTHGSGWMADNGREDAQALAAVLLPRGYAVAGVAVRSSGQAQFPAQLHDIKAAIRWLRVNADKYGIDASRIGIMGESSGGWTAAMAAVTGDVPGLEGDLAPRGPSSRVQAAVAFYPPTDIPSMDAWALKPCNPAAPAFADAFCHLVKDSPESRFLGCVATDCPERAAMASPLKYISKADPPIMILHGEHDALVPHAQGEALYQALNKACHDAAFVSFPMADHGTWVRMLTDLTLAYGATIRSTAAAGCRTVLPAPVEPDWNLVVGFLDRALMNKE